MGQNYSDAADTIVSSDTTAEGDSVVVELKSGPDHWRRAAGRRLRELRGKTSQPVFAERLSVVWGKTIHPSQLSDWESGRRWIRAAILAAAEELARDPSEEVADDLDVVRSDVREIRRLVQRQQSRLEQIDRQVRGYEDLVRGSSDVLQRVLDALAKIQPLEQGAATETDIDD